jgi:hypothetical protein
MAPLKVVFTGTSGIHKGKVIRHFADFLANKWDIADADRESAIRIIEPERHLPISESLESPADHQRTVLQNAYSEALKDAKRYLRNKKTKAIFLSLHATYMEQDRIFSALAWHHERERRKPSMLIAFLKSFGPRHFITLMDDCYYLQQRCRAGSPSISLRLREFMRWREIETLISDHLANEVIPFTATARGEDARRFPYERSPMFAVRQPCETLYRFLYEPRTPRVYASFLIGEIRKRATGERKISMTRQVDRFVTQLSERYCVFNPLTIDEKPLEQLADALDETMSSAVFEKRLRWPNIVEPTLTPYQIEDAQDLHAHELHELFSARGTRERTSLDRQVQYRDFRLVDQSDCIVLYRPTNKADRAKSTWGSGCLAEYIHAKRTLHLKPEFRIFIIRDESDGPMDEFVRESHDSTFKTNDPRIMIFEAKGLDDADVQKDYVDRVIREIENHKDSLVRGRTLVHAPRQPTSQASA